MRRINLNARHGATPNAKQKGRTAVLNFITEITDKQHLPRTGTLKLQQISTDGDTHLRDGIDEAVVRKYAALIQDKILVPKLVVFHDKAGKYWLADGFHQHSAALKLKLKSIAVEIYRGDARDAIFYAATANAKHGLAYSPKERKAIIAMILLDKKWGQSSLRAIARHCGVDHKTVAAIKNDLVASGEFPQNASSIVKRDGTSYGMRTADINHGRKARAAAEKWRAAEVETRRLEDEKRAATGIENRVSLVSKWNVRRGQLYKIASQSVPCHYHYLMCGDSTNKNDTGRLMGDLRANCMVTDPPWGVDYVGKTLARKRIKGDTEKGLEDLLTEAFGCANQVLTEGAAVYVFTPSGALSLVFGNCFVGQGWHFRQTLIWKKDSKVIGRSDYHFQHEQILYGYKPGSGPLGRLGHGKKGWYGDNRQSSVIEVKRPYRSKDHPTMKPTELITTLLQNSCPKGGLIYEPFAGSGTAFVAAERTGRVCRGLEIDEKYVAVILERLSGMGLAVSVVPPRACKVAA